MPRSNHNKTVWAHRFFFPLACLYAMVAAPLSVFAMYGGGWPLALIGQGHAFEMLFGFALAVVAGYTLGPTEPRLLAGYCILWMVARIFQYAAPFSLVALVLSMSFGLALAWRIVPRFTAAKKWRNRLLMPLLGGISALPACYLLAQRVGTQIETRLILHEAILFLALLMAFMGGRVIAPAVAGQLEKQGFNLRARVQPRIEGAFILVLLVAAPALAIPDATGLAGAMAVGAGALVLIRLLRWQLWRCRARPDIIGLGVGYTWLGIGLIIFGIAVATGKHVNSALHVITIGALGTLTCSVMSRTHFQRLRRTPPPTALVLWIFATITIATVSRVAATSFISEDITALLWSAATAWALCFGVLAWLFTAELVQGYANSRVRSRT